MLSNLLRRLSGSDATPLAPDDARIAVAAVLVIAARADHAYEDSERAMIDRVLMARYGLDAGAAMRLRADGEAAEAAATDMYRFTALIKQHIPHEERTSVIEALWRVVLTDDVREAHEELTMRRLTDLLGVDPRDSVLARQRVQGER
ncbi:MAG: TerB family tellurite resistance protein [Caulobacterales bacterium]